MKITPVDVAHKTFGKKVVGFDPHEVNAFIQMVANQLEEMIHERNQLKEQIRQRDLQIAEMRDRDQMLQSTLATATQMTDRLRQDAEREAKIILNDANQRSEVIVRDARESLARIYSEITELKKMRSQFEVNMKALAQAHLTLIEQGERFMPTQSYGGAQC